MRINLFYKYLIMISVPIIASALKKELGSYFSTEAHRDNDIVRYINSAARAIAISRNFQFNQYEYELVVTEWVTTYNIPFQIETYFILDSTWEEVDFEDFMNYHREKDKSDLIWVWGDTVKCTNPWTYTFFYRGYPTQITSLTDSLTIPEHFYDIVILKASYFGFMDIRAYTKANNKETIFTWMIWDMAKRSSNPQPTKKKRLNKSSNNSKVW